MNLGQWGFTLTQIPSKNHRASGVAKLCSSAKMGASSSAMSTVLPRLVLQEVSQAAPALDMEHEMGIHEAFTGSKHTTGLWLGQVCLCGKQSLCAQHSLLAPQAE